MRFNFFKSIQFKDITFSISGYNALTPKTTSTRNFVLQPEDYVSFEIINFNTRMVMIKAQPNR